MKNNKQAFQTNLTGFAHFRHAALWSLRETKVERALLTVSPLLILVVELLNTAIESAIDRIGPEYHELSGRAKDIGSAAVFVTLCAVGLLWAILLFPAL